MRNAGRVLLAFLNLCIRIIVRVATFDTNHSVTDSTQAINRCFISETSDSVVKSVNAVRHRQSMCQTKR